MASLHDEHSPIGRPAPLLRFAPSPNGLLHLGHAYSALFTRAMAMRLNGHWLLRMEDLDPDRSRHGFVAAVYEDLNWLGLNWPKPVLLQSTRSVAYARALENLADQGLTYPCFCTRAAIRERSLAGTDPDGAPLYPGTCKSLSPEQIAKKRAEGLSEQIRLDTRTACQRTGQLSFTEWPVSEQGPPRVSLTRPERWGDVVMRRKNMPAAYHLAVVVDDAFQNITHVTRGKDLEAATDIHVLLQTLLGLPVPAYCFHRLILDQTNQKLSKSRGATSLQTLRKSGTTPSEIRARLGF